MQWFLEFLGIREPPGAPKPPEPVKVSKLYETMNNRKHYLMLGYFLVIGFRTLLSVVYDGKHAAIMTWAAFATPAFIVAWIVHASYTKRQWRRLQKEAKSAGFLHCPTCGHDLRGGTLKGSAQPVPIVTDAAESDIVICPECGEEHRVKALGEIWESP